jgi:hypothetical protein
LLNFKIQSSSVKIEDSEIKGVTKDLIQASTHASAKTAK